MDIRGTTLWQLGQYQGKTGYMKVEKQPLLHCGSSLSENKVRLTKGSWKNGYSLYQVNAMEKSKVTVSMWNQITAKLT